MKTGVFAPNLTNNCWRYGGSDANVVNSICAHPSYRDDRTDAEQQEGIMMAAIVVRGARRAVPILALLTACSGAPLNFMYGAGPVASSLSKLGWWLLIVSAVVVAVVIALVVVGVVRGQRLRDDPSLARTAALGGLTWIYIGGC